jgi:hypothetical protein
MERAFSLAASGTVASIKGLRETLKIKGWPAPWRRYPRERAEAHHLLSEPVGGYEKARIHLPPGKKKPADFNRQAF